MASNIVRVDQVRSIPIASITTSYTAFGFDTSQSTPAPFTHAMRVLNFDNDSNGTYMISFDGITDNTPILANSFKLLDLTSDQDANESFRYQSGTQIWIKYLVAPTSQTMSSNSVYLTCVYGKGE